MIQRIPRAFMTETVTTGFYVVTDVPGATGWYLPTGTSYSSTHRMDYKNEASGYYLFWSLYEGYVPYWWFSAQVGWVAWNCTSYLWSDADLPPLGSWTRNMDMGDCFVSLTQV